MVHRPPGRCLHEREIEAATQDVRDKVATVRFPRDTEPPVVSKIDPDAAPILTLVVFSKRAPKEITQKISDAIAQGFKQPDMQERILKLEATPLGTTPERMRQMIQESTDIWGPVVKENDIKGEM